MDDYEGTWRSVDGWYFSELGNFAGLTGFVLGVTYLPHPPFSAKRIYQNMPKNRLWNGFFTNFNWKWSEIWQKRLVLNFCVHSPISNTFLGYKKTHTLDCAYQKRLNHIKPILKLFWNISHISFLKTSENMWFWKWNLSKWNIDLKIVEQKKISDKREPLKRIFRFPFTLYLEKFLQKLTKAKKNIHEL